MADKRLEIFTEPRDVPAGQKRLEYAVTFPVKDSSVLLLCAIQTTTDGGKTWKTEASQEMHGASDPKESKRFPGKFFSLSVQHDGRPCQSRLSLTGPKEILVQVEAL